MTGKTVRLPQESWILVLFNDSQTAARPTSPIVALGLSFFICKMETLMFISQGYSEALRMPQMWHQM